MKRIAVLGGALAVLATAVVAVSLAVADEPDPKTASSKSAGAAKKFDHEKHSKTKKKVVTDKTCSTCHGDDPKGALVKPGKSGHQPCLSSGCHVNDFLNTSPRMRKKDKKAYDKAAAFCLGCHTSEDGSPPKNYTKAKADNIYENNPNQEYHVELDHLEHVGFKDGKCRDCHVVDPATNELKLDAPGHAECSQCHTGKTEAHAMGTCASCHSRPGPATFFTESRKGSDTRACGSDAHEKLAKRRKKSPKEVPCFKHETLEHRFWSKNRNSRNWEKGEPLQCGHCHFMFADKKHWKRLKGQYQTIKQIKASPLMDTAEGEAHARCGDVRACHGSDFSGDSCRKCHADKSVGTGGSLYD